MKDGRSPAIAMAAAVVFACALAFYSSFSDYGFHREDEGALLIQFWRFASGETPYRDFHVGYTPGVYFVHKTLMQWFGPGLMPGRHLLALVHAASATLLFALTARITASWKWALIPPLLYLGSTPVHAGSFAAFNIPYPSWYNLFFFALSAAVLPSLAARPTIARLLACGLLAGIGFTFKPNVGLFQLAASALVCLQAFGRPRTRIEHLLWWTWWTAIAAGLLVVFASAQSLRELAGFLAPALVAALAVARDAYGCPSRNDRLSLAACATTMSAGFLVVCVPWLAWSWSILGPDWFARRALFLGAGFESVYYLTGPPLGMGLAVLAVAAFAWRLPAWIAARGWPAWPLPPVAAGAATLLLVHLARTRPMPEGLYAAVMKEVEPGIFAAAMFVQLAMLLAWLLRRTGVDDARRRVATTTMLCGVMLYLQVFPRTDLMHWVSSAPLLFPPAVWMMQRLALRWSAGHGRALRRVVGASLALPVLAIALMRIGHFLDARWDIEDGLPVRTPETQLRIAHAPLSINVGRADVFRDLEGAAGFIDANSSPSDAVFTFPALDYLSYFSLRRPGNRHGYYFPGWPGHDTEAEVLASLESRPPRLAVTLYEPQLYFSSAAAYYFLFADFIDARYRSVARSGPYAIFAEDGDRPDVPALPEAGGESSVAEALGSRRMDELEAALASPLAADRVAAVQRMAQWRVLGDFEPLRRALDDNDTAVRSAAVKAVPVTRSPQVREALLRAAADHRLDTVDSVLALRAVFDSCDASCVPLLLPLAGEGDRDIAAAARGVLAAMPTSRWQTDLWWQRSDPATETFPEPALSRLRAALENRDDDPVIRNLAFAYADRLGLGPCPDVLRRWSGMTPEEVGPDFTVCTAVNHLSRASCEGPWFDAALRWLPLDPTLSPRIALREAHRDPAHADAALAEIAGRHLGATSALAGWMCGVVGGPQCLAAARATVKGEGSEEERVAAAWAWAQLAVDEADVDELLLQVKRDASPQVRETAAYGVQRRRVRRQQDAALR